MIKLVIGKIVLAPKKSKSKMEKFINKQKALG